MSQPDEWLPTEEAAALLRVKRNTMEIWRHKGKGPPFIKLGDTPQSPIRYLRSAVMEFAARRTFRSTSAYSTHAKHNNSGPSNPSV